MHEQGRTLTDGTVVVAMSGGVDSSLTLRLLRELVSRPQLTVHVAHSPSRSTSRSSSCATGTHYCPSRQQTRTSQQRRSHTADLHLRESQTSLPVAGNATGPTSTASASTSEFPRKTFSSSISRASTGAECLSLLWKSGARAGHRILMSPATGEYTGNWLGG